MAYWAEKGHRERDGQLKVEKNMESLFNANLGCQLSDEDKVILKDLESKKAKLLLDKEREWRLESRAT